MKEAEPLPETTLLFDVWLIMHLVEGLLDQRLNNSGLTADDFGLYSLLMYGGPVTLTQLARWTGMRPTTISATLKRLQERGDVVRSPHPNDGRSHIIALTNAGIARYHAARPAFREAIQEITLALGPREETIRMHFQQLDMVLRQISGNDPRPYALTEQIPPAASEPENVYQFRYHGRALTSQEEADVRRYLRFIQSSRSDDDARKEAIDASITNS